MKIEVYLQSIILCKITSVHAILKSLKDVEIEKSEGQWAPALVILFPRCH